MIDQVVEIQRENKRNYVKLSTTFGTVLENINKDKTEFEYNIFTPNDSDPENVNLHIVNLNDNNDINEYKRLIRSQIIQSYEKTKTLNSSNLIIAIYSMQITVYYVANFGGKGLLSPDVRALVNKHYAHSYSGDGKNFFNICWFAIVVYYLHYKDDKKENLSEMIEMFHI
jgi:hypothetical protein